MLRRGKYSYSRGDYQSRSPLATVRRFAIPRKIIDSTLLVLQQAGDAGSEAFVVWGGTPDGEELEFKSMLVPAQTGHQTRNGLLVTVNGEALFQVNKELFDRGEVLAAQVHSHPTAAFHSDTDDCFSLVTLVGALSIVVPYFGHNGLADLGDWAWYRLAGEGRWARLHRRDRVEIV
jgi:hypothetical protein